MAEEGFFILEVRWRSAGNLHRAPLTKSSRQCVPRRSRREKALFLSSTALISPGAATTVDIRGENDQLGGPRRDGSPLREPLMDFPWVQGGRNRSSSQHLSMRSSTIGQPCASVRVWSGAAVINGQQKGMLGCLAHSVWAAFLFRGRRSGKLFSETRAPT